VLELVFEEVACVLPTTAAAGLDQLGLSGAIGVRGADWPQWPQAQAGRVLGKIEPLFPLLEDEKEKGK
jgi:hypothetical protein